MKFIDPAVLRRALIEQWAISIHVRGELTPARPELQQSLDYAYGQVDAVKRIAAIVGFSEDEMRSIREAAVGMVVDRSAETLPAAVGE